MKSNKNFSNKKCNPIHLRIKNVSLWIQYGKNNKMYQGGLQIILILEATKFKYYLNRSESITLRSTSTAFSYATNSKMK